LTTYWFLEVNEMNKVNNLNRLQPSPRVMQARASCERLRAGITTVLANRESGLANAHNENAGLLTEQTRDSAAFVGEWAYGVQNADELEITVKNLMAVVKQHDTKELAVQALQCLFTAIKEAREVKEARIFAFKMRETIKASSKAGLEQAMTAFDACISALASFEQSLAPAPVIAQELNNLKLSKWFRLN
jgi:hypothetical protein